MKQKISNPWAFCDCFIHTLDLKQNLSKQSNEFWSIRLAFETMKKRNLPREQIFLFASFYFQEQFVLGLQLLQWAHRIPGMLVLSYPGCKSCLQSKQDCICFLGLVLHVFLCHVVLELVFNLSPLSPIYKSPYISSHFHRCPCLASNI